jgi:23S rRNA pseudouridine2604 synthase
MRINKFISETGMCSRRQADQWIIDKRVQINGQLAELGSVVQDGDEVCVDGQVIQKARRLVYIALNKPRGITCTTEIQVKGNIISYISHPERIFPIGRLDKDSEGLILLTNDGDIVNQILRSEYNHEKEYIVKVNNRITSDFLEIMASGLKILGTLTKPCQVEKVQEDVFRIILTQGLNRQIRRMCKALGYQVLSLQRTRIMNIHLHPLPLGQWRDLTHEEVNELKTMITLKPV